MKYTLNCKSDLVIDTFELLVPVLAAVELNFLKVAGVGLCFRFVLITGLII